MLRKEFAMKKSLLKIALLILFLTLLTACSKQSDTKPVSAAPTGSHAEISLSYKNQPGMASNQYAIWVEDEKGNHIKTIYATKFTAKTGFSKRPESLPTWVAKSKIANMSEKQADAFTSATPGSGTQKYTWDMTDQNGQKVPDGKYKILIEASIFWKSKIIYEAVLFTQEPSIKNIEVKQQNMYTESKNLDMVTDVKITFIPKNK